jgi:hypothetical protein
VFLSGTLRDRSDSEVLFQVTSEILLSPLWSMMLQVSDIVMVGFLIVFTCCILGGVTYIVCYVKLLTFNDIVP